MNDTCVKQADLTRLQFKVYRFRLVEPVRNILTPRQYAVGISRVHMRQGSGFMGTGYHLQTAMRHCAIRQR